jgi:hypothetical protein
MDRYEAIEVLRKYSPKDAELREALETAVPELKESEDDKTKRMLDIITYKMSQHQPDIFTGEENEWFNAWLERQGGKNPAWSEEDEGIVSRITNDLENCECEWGSDKQEEKDWLRTLKDRVQPHPAWKPTEEQMEAIRQAAEQNRASEIGNILENLLVEIKTM